LLLRWSGVCCDIFTPYSTEHSPSSEANRFSVRQETPHILQNPNVHYRNHNYYYYHHHHHHLMTSYFSSTNHDGSFLLQLTNQQFIPQKSIPQQCIIHTATCFDIFMSSSGSLQLRLAKSHKFSKLQLL
jgi:hypothetical protein